MTKQQLNRCGSCGHTWKPKGQSLSANCPNCNSTDTRYSIEKNTEGESKEKRTSKASSSLPPNSPINPIPPSFGGPAPASRTSPSRPDAAPTSKSNAPPPKKKNFAAVVILFLLVIGVIGGLVYLRTGDQFFRMFGLSSPFQTSNKTESAACQDIAEKFNYAQRMAKKSPRKWKKWIAHWQEKAQEEGCTLPSKP